MVQSIHVESTAVEPPLWEKRAKEFFSMGPVGVLEGETIFARVNGFVDDGCSAACALDRPLRLRGSVMEWKIEYDQRRDDSTCRFVVGSPWGNRFSG